MPDLASFIVVAFLIVITPGADMALVARNTLSGGRSHGLMTAFGVVSGVLVHGAAAALGLSALISASSSAYQALRIVGALYLILLGLQSLWSAWRGASSTPAVQAPKSRNHPYTHGLMTNVLNPKLSLLFLSLMPQFLNEGAAATPQILLLTAVFLAIGVAWLVFYVLLIHRVRAKLDQTRVRRVIDAAVGALLVALGLRVLR